MAPGPRVQRGAPPLQTAQNGPDRVLVFRRSPTGLPAASDDRHVLKRGQLPSPRPDIHEGGGVDGGRVRGACLNDPGAVRRREGNPGAREQVRKFDARISVGGLPKSKPATFALPRSPMRMSAGSDAASSMEATGTTRAPRDEDRDRGARPERARHDHHRSGPGRRPPVSLPA
jgi:hypothetical protein